MTTDTHLGKFNDIVGCDRLLILVSQAIAGWLTIQRCCSRRSSVYEHSLYLPIIEVAKSQNWQVSHERELVNSKRLKGRKIDFVFEQKRCIASLEVKYIDDITCATKTYFSGKKYLPKDIENSTFFFEEKRGLMHYSFIIICGYKRALLNALPSRPKDKVCRYVYGRARQILEAEADNVFNDYGWRCDEVGENTNKMTVLVLRNRGVWHKI